MIPHVRKPPDEFGSYLRSLRNKRHMPGDRLSAKLDKSKTYIGDWERNANLRPNREVLIRVAEVLQLAEPERRKLFRLADQRAVPQAAMLQNPFGVDAHANLLHELLRIDGYEWPAEPKEPTPEHQPESELLDAIGWVLARHAATRDILPPFTHIAWPEDLVRIGALPPVDATVFPDGAPEQFQIPYSLFTGGPINRLELEDVANHSVVMAHAYRDLLFGDLDRTREIVKELQCWTCRGDGLTTRLTLRFRTTDAQEGYGVNDVDMDVVSAVGERSLAFYLWLGWRKGKRQKSRPLWFCDLDSTDMNALTTVGRAHPDTLRTRRDRGVLRDALYAMQSPFWWCILLLLRTHYNVGEGSKHDLEQELATVPLCEATRLRILAEPWQLSVVDPARCIQYLRSLHEMPLADGAEPDREPRPVGERKRSTRTRREAATAKRKQNSVEPMANKSTKAKARKTVKRVRKRKGK